MQTARLQLFLSAGDYTPRAESAEKQTNRPAICLRNKNLCPFVREEQRGRLWKETRKSSRRENRRITARGNEPPYVAKGMFYMLDICTVPTERCCCYARRIGNYLFAGYSNTNHLRSEGVCHLFSEKQSERRTSRETCPYGTKKPVAEDNLSVAGYSNINRLRSEASSVSNVLENVRNL